MYACTYKYVFICMRVGLFLSDSVHHANTAVRQCRNFSAHLAKCVWEIRILCRSSRYCQMHRHPFETVVKLNKQAMGISVH